METDTESPQQLDPEESRPTTSFQPPQPQQQQLQSPQPQEQQA